MLANVGTSLEYCLSINLSMIFLDSLDKGLLIFYFFGTSRVLNTSEKCDLNSDISRSHVWC